MFRTRKNNQFTYKPKYFEENKTKKTLFQKKTISKSKYRLIIFLIMLFLFVSVFSYVSSIGSIK